MKVNQLRLAFHLCLASSIGMVQASVSGKVLKVSSLVKSKVLINNYKFAADPNVKIPVLVYLKDKANLSGTEKIKDRVKRGQEVYKRLSSKALATQGGVVQLLKSRQAAYQQFYIVNMIAVYNANSKLVAELAARKDVEKVMGNPTMRMTEPHNFPFEITETMDNVVKKQVGANISAIGADRVWKDFNTMGEGIVLAGQDTGVEFDHPGLVNQYRGTTLKGIDHSYNWHDAIHEKNFGDRGNKCGIATEAPCDDNAHGTHTVGTMLGADSSRIVGVAPKSQWVACRNMDAGNGTPATYIECFEWFLAPYKLGQNPMKEGRPELAPHIINNSWGCPRSEGCQGSEMVDVLNAMEKAGIMVVVSAGNDGPRCSTISSQPSTLTDTIMSVGAYNHRNNQVAYFSSRGPSTFDKKVGPNLVAPGVSINSTVPGGGYQGGFWSGTSMAGPHIAGVVALMWSANKNLIGDIRTTIKILQATSKPLAVKQACGGIAGSAVPNNTSGHGMVDAYAAVKKAKDLLIKPLPKLSEKKLIIQN